MKWFSNLGIGILFLWIALPVNAENHNKINKLGKIEFRTSGSLSSQKHFIRGVGALHSFWYKEALASFQLSIKEDPKFIMGHWGEAMAHNQPLWEGQNTTKGRSALAKINGLTGVTNREKLYVEAIKLLYGQGEKISRDKAYSDAMEKLYLRYPEDLEAACFYALSLLGIARNSEEKLALQIKAGEIAQEVFRKNPDHPCAAHYIIHAFDHPKLAERALPAALRYAKIAPAAHHAQHMPAHIFLQLGMWPEAALSNEAGWKKSVAWVKNQRLPIGNRDYHSLHWLHYVYLQQGLYGKARQVLQLKMRDILDENVKAAPPDLKTRQRVRKYLERMIGASVFERGDWTWIEAFKEPLGWKPKGYTRAVLAFIRGFSEGIRGRIDSKKYLNELQTIKNGGFSKNYFKRPEHLDIWSLEIQAAIQVSKKNYDEAIFIMKKATVMEGELPSPSGPPGIIKPTFEWLGEIFLQAGKPEEAAQQFAISLSRHPYRARSLLGSARAAALQNKLVEASKKYSSFIDIWKHADSDLPELKEARNYLRW